MYRFPTENAPEDEKYASDGVENKENIMTNVNKSLFFFIH
jgi:hypothetical protein